MKHTPFFKFDAMAWLGGSIQFASLEEKGLFVDICAMYWNTWEPVQINQRFKVRYRYLEGTLSDLLGTLSDLGVITSTTQGYTVPFLDELIGDRQEWLDKCSKAGKKSAAARGTSSNKKEESRKKIVESREKNSKSARFKPPTVDEVTVYCQERGNGINPGHWIDHYESNGWMVGKNKMKSWKAAIRTWERNGYSNTAQSAQPQKISPEDWER